MIDILSKIGFKIILIQIIFFFCIDIVYAEKIDNLLKFNEIQFFFAEEDTVKLKFLFEDNSYEPFNSRYSPFILGNPENIKSNWVYDPITGNFKYQEKIGTSLMYRPNNYMTEEEYKQYELDQSISNYWSEKISTEHEFNKENRWLIPPINVKNKLFELLFGGNTINIKPSGSAELLLGFKSTNTKNPSLTERQRKNTIFDFNQKIQVNLDGNIGKYIKLSGNFNNLATFNFENFLKLGYDGNEDQIIQSIKLGNVSLPLKGSLIQGSQSLFGVKTQLKFGHLTISTVFSRQQGERKQVTVENGAQKNKFEIKADQYDYNQHFFLSHYFREHYETAVGFPPIINTGIKITKIEVWITNTNFTTENVRNLVSFQDLGESRVIYNSSKTISNGGELPYNKANNLYDIVSSSPDVRGYLQASNYLQDRGYKPRLDYQRMESARKLKANEFEYNNQLGYISLNQQILPNQALAVAFQYTYRGKVYQVGEFSTDGVNGTDALILKMLKSTQLSIQSPMWDLMMKNIYSLNSYSIQKKGFKLNVFYLNRTQGTTTNYIPEEKVKGIPLIKIMGMDKLDVNGNLISDGLFDFLSNPIITINKEKAKVIFPVLEPFGSTLRKALGNNTYTDNYVFDSLYTSTQIDASVKYPEKNRFTIKGEYKSSSSNEINLNAFNVPEGSVIVTAGGKTLIENEDYRVDYTIGRVKILNQGLLESGTPINVSLESKSLFNVQQKTLIASRFDYNYSKNLQLGATLMNLRETPLTQKVNAGNEAMSNIVYGVDFNYFTESKLITNIIDKIPFVNTKEKSSIKVSGEFAQLVPRTSKVVGSNNTAYIDDFEGSQSTIDLRSFTQWNISSIPQGQPNLFPEAYLKNNLNNGSNRAKLAWYIVDPLFYQNNPLTPDHIKGNTDMLSNNFMRQIFEKEVFPNRQFISGQLNNISIFDLAYYPEERGPYNYDLGQKDTITNRTYSAGLNPDGTLKIPESRWGGIMRKIDQYDFESANIEFIQFWVMDPFNEDYEYPLNESGQLYFNLGNISEDIQRDGYKFTENGLPTDLAVVQDLTGNDFSNLGRITTGQQIVNGFNNNSEVRQYQDVGLDGLRNIEERQFYKNYVEQAKILSPQVANDIEKDPSADDFNYFRGTNLDNIKANILERYKKYNGLEGNSPAQSNFSNSQLPNIEDFNRDNTLDEIESYWQYKVDISPSAINSNNVGNNFITNVLETNIKAKNGKSKKIKWYQFRIPIKKTGQNINGIKDFHSIRFMRIFLKGFKNPIQLRFARLELIRGEWRKYEKDLDVAGDYILEEDNTKFFVSAVNIEENSSKTPVNYVIPPGISREINVATTNLQRLNEQALSMVVCNLEDGKTKATYRNINLDVRSYKKIRLYVHGESANNDNLTNDDLSAFIRIGSDFNENYYEYEIPLAITQAGYYGNTDSERKKVWPTSNQIEIDFKTLRTAKTLRNRAVLLGNTSNDYRYAYNKDNATVYVVGNPNLSNVKVVMMGVRNKKKTINRIEDDGLPKCVEVWFNELRLTDIDNRSGWASTASVQLKLADLTDVNVSGSMSTPGWGGIEKKVSERARETNQNLETSANINGNKFFNKKIGINLPIYLGYSINRIKPQFSPADPDIELDNYINESFITKKQKDSVRNVVETRIIRRSLNLTNIKKTKTNKDKKNRIYDISNVSADYSFSDIKKTNFETEFDYTKKYKVLVQYNFNPKPLIIRPFYKIKILRKSKYLRLIRDMNLHLTPQKIGVKTEINRSYQESKQRNIQPNLEINTPIYVNKSFFWNSGYNFKYNLTDNISVDFRATNRSLIREPSGRVDKNDEDSYNYWKDSIRAQFSNFGTGMEYNHSTNISYRLPLNKFPLTNWINASINYNSTYRWDRAKFAADSLGHIIQNSSTIQWNSNFNFITFYNKVKYLKKLNNPKKTISRSFKSKNKQTEKNDNSSNFNILDEIFKLLMMVKNGSLTYTLNRGSLIPGFNKEVKLFGVSDLSFSESGASAPGLGFILGQQDGFGSYKSNFMDYAADKDWLVKQNNLNVAVSNVFSEQINARVKVEPIKSLKINITATMQKGYNYQEYYRWNDTIYNDDGTFDPNGGFKIESPQRTGNLSFTFNAIRTAFVKNRNDFSSPVFDKFKENRKIISKRLANAKGINENHQIDKDFYDGYGAGNIDVLIPAFLATYSDKNIETQNLNIFKNLPLPNWNITYSGLSKIKYFKKIFRSININHSYKCTYNIASYTTNVLYRENENIRDPILAANFVPQYEIPTVSISEQFSPLININMTWKNSLITKFEIKKLRNISLSTTNAQITENTNDEIVLGIGYSFKNVPIPFQGKLKFKKKTKSNLIIRFDLSINDNKIVIRKLNDENKPNEPTGGQKIYIIKFTADYALSKQLNLRFYFDRISNIPVISNSYPTINTKGGISLRFSLIS